MAMEGPQIMDLQAPFMTEEGRREYYSKCKCDKWLRNDLLEGLDPPQFSTLNSDVIPSPEFLESLDNHQAKFDLDLIKQIWEGIGL